MAKLRKSTFKMGRMDRQVDRWKDEKDRLFKTPSFKMVVWSCFSQIQEPNFLKSYGLVVSLMERFNTWKRNTITIVQCSKREHWKYIHELDSNTFSKLLKTYGMYEDTRQKNFYYKINELIRKATHCKRIWIIWR